MRGSALIFVIGMFAAAIVGIAAAFAMQTALPTKAAPGAEPVSTDVTTDILRNDINAFEQRMRAEIGELTASVDSLNGQMQTLKKEMQTFVAQAGTAGSGAAVVADAEGQPAVVGNLDTAINRVLDDRDKRREEEREQERTQRATEMRDRFKGMMTSRTERYAEEKGWAPAVTEQVKVIMSDYMDKMGEFGMSGFGRRRGGSGGSDEDREKMRQLMDDTRAKLLSIVSEEEANELLQGGMGGRGPGGNRGGGQGGGRGR